MGRTAGSKQQVAGSERGGRGEEAWRRKGARKGEAAGAQGCLEEGNRAIRQLPIRIPRTEVKNRRK